MDLLLAETLEDPRHVVVSPGPPSGRGLAWVRTHVARFSEGVAHTRRRGLVDAVVAGLLDAPLVGDPTTSLLLALGLDGALWSDVHRAAAAYQPHAPQDPAADAAADRLVAACGGRTEASAARVCVLLQAHTATRAMLEVRRQGTDEPPVPRTRRVGPDGREVEVDLTEAPFGRGRHRCPGEALARRLVDEVRR